MTGVKAHHDFFLFLSKLLLWCERAYRPFSSFRLGEDAQFSLSMGAQLLLTSFCYAKQYAVTTWQPREARTHPLLQLLELCNHNHNLPYGPQYPQLTFLTPVRITASYRVFITSNKLLALFSYCEQTPGLPLSHRDQRMRQLLTGFLSRAHGTVSRGVAQQPSHTCF